MGLIKAGFNYKDNMQRVMGSVPGRYGATQSYPSKFPGQYRDLIYKYYPKYSEQEINDLLVKLASEGCSYAALTNTVFLYFIDHEELFEKIFGIPMYVNGSELNFNGLMLDFYLAMDNHNPFMTPWGRIDYVNRKEDVSQTKGVGTNSYQREWRFERYMKKHGIKVNVKNIKAGLAAYEKKSSKGPWIANTNPNVLYDEYGREVYSSTNGHSMLVTDVMPNGSVKVSSWGEWYYLRPGSYSQSETYEQVIYKRIPVSAFGRWIIKVISCPKPLWVWFLAWCLEQ